MEYRYELYDENGTTIAYGSCDSTNSEQANDIAWAELDNLQQIYDTQKDKGEPNCYCYEITAIMENGDKNEMETFTVTIK